MKKRNRRPHDLKPPLWHSVLDYGYIILGSIFVAIAFNVFLLPNGIASGGVSGISTILNGLFDWRPSLVQLVINIPLLIAGLIFLGIQFGVKTAVGSFFLPLAVFLTESWEPWTEDPLLGALFGGIGLGIGLGIVFRGKGSTGGTALVAQIIHKYSGIGLGKCVGLIDGLVVLSAAIVFDIERGLYAMIGLYVTSKTIDLVQVGFGQSKMLYIITNRQEQISQAIFEEVDRGVTKLSAQGGYTDHERPILMCVIDQTEFSKLKNVVKKIDPNAFVIVSDASEVLGEGFKRA
ncbi:YitT family protein [Jeotgalibacillus marinus]|uniref:YitT family protein n=1 Tax=Jeotgalibacillus marinus TaxID=86667 RepID=A0ABV3Q4U2_9BACL